MRTIILSICSLLALLSQLLVFQHCANPTPPQGGVKDTIGPVLTILGTTPAYQTNFRPKQIELTFDEWVKIKDPTQIIVSPPLDPQPKVRLKKKTLIIDFGEAIFRDSATYVINIGEAIVDLNESNPPDNLRFVFATGPILDSASVSGRLLDAYSAEPLDGAIMALYANLTDSIVSSENPFYFAKTNKAGEYEISNIRPGTYRAIALDNGGFGGYKYEPNTSKQLGFPDSFLLLPDAATQLPPIRLFSPEKPLRILKKDTSQLGIIKLSLNRPAEQLRYQSKQNYAQIYQGDTLRLFYTHQEADTLLFGLDTNWTDTLFFLPLSTTQPPLLSLAPALGAQTGTPSNHNPTQAYTLIFNHPLASLDSAAIVLYQDTLEEKLTLLASIDSLESNRLLISKKWTENENLRLFLLPGALEDIFGQRNIDTIKASFRVDEKKKYGNLLLSFEGLDSLQQYIVRIVKGNNRDLVTQFIIPNGYSKFQRNFIGFNPGTYKIEVVTDENKNSRYDPGDYYQARQPENVQIFEVEALRPNWDLEVNIELVSD